MFLALGHAPTLYLGSPIFGIAAAVAGIIPYGSTATSYEVAVLRGVLLGTLAGVALSSALQIRFKEVTVGFLVFYAVLTAAMCMAAAVLFCYMRRRREAAIENDWR